jgi:flagellar protein FlbD
MIKVTRLNEQLLVVNADLIEFVEELPDTIITLTTGKKVMVKEDVDTIIDKVTTYRRACRASAPAGV